MPFISPLKFDNLTSALAFQARTSEKKLVNRVRIEFMMLTSMNQKNLNFVHGFYSTTCRKFKRKKMQTFQLNQKTDRKTIKTSIAWMSWMIWNFVRSHEILPQTVSAFYFKKQKSFIPKYIKIDPKDGACCSNFQWRFWHWPFVLSVDSNLNVFSQC